MAGKSFTVADTAAANKTFTPTILVAGGSQYAETTSPFRVATIKHTMPNLGQTGAVDKHLVQFQHMVPDALGKPVFATVNITVQFPRNTVSRANLNDLLAFAKNFIGSSTIVDGLVIGDY